MMVMHTSSPGSSTVGANAFATRFRASLALRQNTTSRASAAELEARDVGAGLVDGLGGVHRQAIKAAQGVRVHLLVEAALRVEGDGRASAVAALSRKARPGLAASRGKSCWVGVRGYVDAHATASSILMPRAAARRVTDARVRWSGALMAASSKEAVMNKRSASSGEIPRLAR